MGRIEKIRHGLASALFSQVQLRVLSLLLGHPNKSFHVSEIIRLARSGSGAVQRELETLAEAGIIKSESAGNRKIYQANKQAPIFRELHSIILKTTGLIDPIRTALKKFQKQISIAFVYGSVAKGSDTANSDVDIMIVSDDLSYSPVFSALQDAEKIIGRPINPNLMTSGEWTKNISAENAFVTKILKQPKLMIFGTEDELEGSR